MSTTPYVYDRLPPFEYRLRKRTTMLVVHDSKTTPEAVKPLEVLRWAARQQGMLDIGYHIVIDRDGCFHLLRPLDRMGCHAAGYNDESIGLCMLGGLNAAGERANNFTRVQMTALQGAACAFLHEYRPIEPEARVIGLKELGGYRKKSDSPALDMRALRAFLIERRVQRVPILSQLLKRGDVRRVTPSRIDPELPQEGP